MRSFTRRVHIDRSPERVFAVLTELPSVPGWRSLVRKMEVVGGGPLRKDAQVVVTIDVVGEVRQAISEVWSYDPPRRFGTRNTASRVTGIFEYQLEPAPGGGTDVTFTCDVKPHGFMWLLLPLLIHSNRTRYADQLERLKRAVERAA
jgi:uncharacterized protein YndB with AHSA1/START domain